VTGLAGEHATVSAALYGPFATRAAIVCTGTPAWTGTLDVPADGTYVTAPFTVQVPGYYTYRESIAAAGFVRAVQTTCADTAESTIVTAQPKISTQVSSQQTAPGATITDKAVVSGLGGLQAEVKVELWGPFASLAAIRCAVLARIVHRQGRRDLHDGARQAQEGGLLHVSRVDHRHAGLRSLHGRVRGRC
jgi:hypothetical protein